MRAPGLPSHIAIIMDGNGRWAKARGLPRSEGHRQGLAAAKRIVQASSARGIGFLSLYTFSTENWKRTREEVGFLMGLIRSHLSSELDFYRANRLRVIHSGSRQGLDSPILAEIDKVCRDTADSPGMVVNLAINYGGRDEILRSFRRALDSAASGGMSPSGSLEDILRSGMDHPELPDPDLIIRTGGEMRLSNFLLWQSAYSELYFCDRLWPDFDAEDLDKALSSYALRDRRFGGTP